MKGNKGERKRRKRNDLLKEYKIKLNKKAKREKLWSES
jgi:hypothetical protein